MNKEEQIIAAMHNLYNKIGFLNKQKLAEYLKDDSERIGTYTSSEISCIEYIGDNVDPNVTKLAEACFMTRSALSKLTKKLMKKGIIESYQKPDNKKEIYFRLTEKGREAYNIHAEVTSNFIRRDKVVFEQTPIEQLDNMLLFFERYDKHLDAELKRMGVDNS